MPAEQQDDALGSIDGGMVCGDLRGHIDYRDRHRVIFGVKR